MTSKDEKGKVGNRGGKVVMVKSRIEIVLEMALGDWSLNTNLRLCLMMKG